MQQYFKLKLVYLVIIQYVYLQVKSFCCGVYNIDLSQLKQRAYNILIAIINK